jgi:hypothetical protein
MLHSDARRQAANIVPYRERRFWESHGWPVIGLLAFVLIESAVIAVLLVHRGRRVRSEQEAALVAEISSKFVNLPATEVDREIMAVRRPAGGPQLRQAPAFVGPFQRLSDVRVVALQ